MQRFVRIQALVTVDVLHHHDGVVHQDANREDERKQRHAVEREAPGPTGKQGGGEGEDDGAAHNHRFAAPQRQAHQQDDRAGGKGQLLNQLVGFVGGGLAIVARDRHLHTVGDEGVAQGVHTGTHRTRHIDRVFTGLFGDAQGHGGIDLAGGGMR